ncbi:allantoate amidohydrolase [Rathayibacter sp. Leaf296]|uniref:allantoate amidohydrolase n=1 Tax=Rathayibacter sp. Leaf296 TaxID=1736327 RepID=UPI000702AF6B|nr:allantoate amidohydrolase [Rathayibacter sp. Leaf296]KQQ09858.1 Zn-dependent hydrolase [Rathayibacter sp. Leaf296]
MSATGGVPALLAEIDGVGRDRTRGGYSRHVFDRGERELREWFVERAEGLGLGVETDRNGNLWAWWGEPGDDAVVTGSHLDSVPGGGAFDGPLGVASALVAVEELRASGVVPSRPFAVVVFAEEEGSRFGIACLGSRLLSGAISGERAAALRDSDGVSFGEAASAAGLSVPHLGVDREALGRLGLFVELHVEQGRGLIDLDAPIAVASSILAHGRWRLSFSGEGNHAGTTAIEDRRDPMVAAARAVLASREVAAERTPTRATVGRLVPVPGGTNVIASRVDTWLDVRSGVDAQARAAVEDIFARAHAAAEQEGCALEVVEESYGAEVAFDPALRDRLVGALGGAVPVLESGAGHDAGILAGSVPTAMLFVRNPTGVSHSPEEFAEDDDCRRGADALVRVLRDLL